MKDYNKIDAIVEFINKQIKEDFDGSSCEVCFDILNFIKSINEPIKKRCSCFGMSISCPHTIENPKEAIFDTNRKHYPVHSGCFKYFPKALTYISHVSWVGNEQHNPGQPLHWDRNKSTDDADARARHILGDDIDVDGLLEEGKAAWRSLATLEKILEDKGFKI